MTDPLGCGKYSKQLREADERFRALEGLCSSMLTEKDATIEALLTFFRWAMQEGPWQGGDLDGGSVQDKAESLGLIVSVPYDPEKHGTYNDYGCDAGDPWFEYAPHVRASVGSPGKSP